MENGYVVFFDSGIGGLTLLRTCAARTEGVRYLYFGDNANAPYGNLGAERICELAQASFDYLAGFPVKAAVIACNTVTAECAAYLRARYSFPVIGVEPAVKPAARVCKNVLVLATRATLQSKKFSALVESVRGDCRIALHCPARLAGDIEENIFDLRRVDLSRHLPQGKFDGAVLGCTHYIFMRREISAYLNCPVFDGNEGTAARLEKVLSQTAEKGEDVRKALNPDEVKEYVLIRKNEKNVKKCGGNVVFFAGDSAFKNKRVFLTLL